MHGAGQEGRRRFLRMKPLAMTRRLRACGFVMAYCF
jgi:hypothetical protein